MLSLKRSCANQQYTLDIRTNVERSVLHRICSLCFQDELQKAVQVWNESFRAFVGTENGKKSGIDLRDWGH
jgi:hypothetical protein